MKKLNGLARKRLKDLCKALKRGRFAQIEQKANALAKTKPVQCIGAERAIVATVNAAFERIEAERPAYVRRKRIAEGNRQIKIERRHAEETARRERATARAEQRAADKIAKAEEAARVAQEAKKSAALAKRRATIAAKKSTAGRGA